MKGKRLNDMSDRERAAYREIKAEGLPLADQYQADEARNREGYGSPASHFLAGYIAAKLEWDKPEDGQ